MAIIRASGANVPITNPGPFVVVQSGQLIGADLLQEKIVTRSGDTIPVENTTTGAPRNIRTPVGHGKVGIQQYSEP